MPGPRYPTTQRGEYANFASHSCVEKNWNVCPSTKNIMSFEQDPGPIDTNVSTVRVTVFGSIPRSSADMERRTRPGRRDHNGTLIAGCRAFYWDLIGQGLWEPRKWARIGNSNIIPQLGWWIWRWNLQDCILGREWSAQTRFVLNPNSFFCSIQLIYFSFSICLPLALLPF